MRESQQDHRNAGWETQRLRDNVSTDQSECPTTQNHDAESR